MRPMSFTLLAVLLGTLQLAQHTLVLGQDRELHAAYIQVGDATEGRLAELKASGANTIVFPVASAAAAAKEAITDASKAVQRNGLSVAYWIEVARTPELADKHPDWMASLQTHDEWRRLFPDAPTPNSDEVMKTYPWVPILSREPFNAQRERVLGLLADLPQAKFVFLNDLQGAPSACGCGNALCRWTSDYGEQRTTIPLGDDAAALFVSHISKAVPNSDVVPVWATECEEHDGEPDGLCAGVGCFKGICWKAYTRQLMPLANTVEHIAVLTPYKLFEREDSRYGLDQASWVEFAVKTFEKVPPQNGGKPIPAQQVIAVVQGWDVTQEELAAQHEAAKRSGAKGIITLYDAIEQSWLPKLVRLK